DFEAAGDGGSLSIAADGEVVARGAVARRPKMLAGNGETFDTGRDSNVPVIVDAGLRAPSDRKIAHAGMMRISSRPRTAANASETQIPMHAGMLAIVAGEHSRGPGSEPAAASARRG
ncbi:MAG: hypothetical protein ACK2UL_02470, partial [Anaerolineae bacterium]